MKSTNERIHTHWEFSNFHCESNFPDIGLEWNFLRSLWKQTKIATKNCTLVTDIYPWFLYLEFDSAQKRDEAKQVVKDLYPENPEDPKMRFLPIYKDADKTCELWEYAADFDFEGKSYLILNARLWLEDNQITDLERWVYKWVVFDLALYDSADSSAIMGEVEKKVDKIL